MSQRDEFITWVHMVLRDAEVAVHNGDTSARRALWSRNDPVTVLGARLHRRVRAHLGVGRRGAAHVHAARHADLSLGGRRVEGGAPTWQRPPDLTSDP
jgi:hypothetical protein